MAALGYSWVAVDCMACWRFGSRFFRWAVLCGLIIPAFAPDSGYAGSRSGAPAVNCPLEQGRSGRVARIIDGDTLVLTDGLVVRLIGAMAPKMPPGAAGVEAHPLAERSVAALEAMTAGRAVQLYFGGRRSDRYGRALAHLFVVAADAPVWVQEKLIDAGLARAYSFEDNRQCLRHLLTVETAARQGKRGIWARSAYAVRPARPPAALLDLADTFQIVEGEIISAHAVSNRVYLNFGRIWKEDFTGSISERDYAKFREAGFDLVALEGRKVRIRGWIERRGGPMIVLTHPEQLEYAGDESAEN